MSMRMIKSKGIALLCLAAVACVAGLWGFHNFSRTRPLASTQTGAFTTPDQPAPQGKVPAAPSLDEDAPITAWTGPSIPSALPNLGPESALASRQPVPSLGMANPKVAAAADGGLLVVGFKPGGGALLEKFDLTGIPIWDDEGRGLELDGVTTISCLEPAPDGGCFLAGGWSGSGSTRPEDETQFIAYIDRTGISRWRAYHQPFLRFGDPGEYRVNRVLPMPQGGCVAVGTAHDGDGTHAWVLKLGGDGMPLWHQDSRDGLRFEDGGNESLWNAALLPDGGLIAIGQAGTEPTGIFRRAHGEGTVEVRPSSRFNFVPSVGDGWMLWLDAQGHSLIESYGVGAGRRFTGVHFSDLAVGANGCAFLAGSAWLSQNQGSGGFLYVIDTTWRSSAQDSVQLKGGRTIGPICTAIIGSSVYPAEGGGGFLHVAPTKDGGCLLVGRAAPKVGNALETWSVKQDPDGHTGPNQGNAIGCFLPDSGAAPPTAFHPECEGVWSLSPKRISPGTPFRFARVTEGGTLSWSCNPQSPNTSVVMSAPQPDRGDLIFQGVGDEGLWTVRLDSSGRVSTPIRP